MMHCIGKGGYGKVWKVVHPMTSKQYAMKQMQKVRIVVRESLDDILAEQRFLAKLKHPFIVNM